MTKKSQRYMRCFNISLRQCRPYSRAELSRNSNFAQKFSSRRSSHNRLATFARNVTGRNFGRRYTYVRAHPFRIYCEFTADRNCISIAPARRISACRARPLESSLLLFVRTRRHSRIHHVEQVTPVSTGCYQERRF